jgi:hypothetical protein
MIAQRLALRAGQLRRLPSNVPSIIQQRVAPRRRVSRTSFTVQPVRWAGTVTEDKSSGHITAAQNESILFFDSKSLSRRHLNIVAVYSMSFTDE